jgi:hypothetical protein
LETIKAWGSVRSSREKDQKPRTEMKESLQGCRKERSLKNRLRDIAEVKGLKSSRTKMWSAMLIFFFLEGELR